MTNDQQSEAKFCPTCHGEGKLWCAWCGKWGDHQSGWCPEFKNSKSEVDKAWQQWWQSSSVSWPEKDGFKAAWEIQQAKIDAMKSCIERITSIALVNVEFFEKELNRPVYVEGFKSIIQLGQGLRHVSDYVNRNVVLEDKITRLESILKIARTALNDISNIDMTVRTGPTPYHVAIVALGAMNTFDQEIGDK